MQARLLVLATFCATGVIAADAAAGVRLVFPRRHHESPSRRESPPPPPPPAPSPENCGDTFEPPLGPRPSSQPAIDALAAKDTELVFCPGDGTLDVILLGLETASGVRLDYRGQSTPARACYETRSVGVILADLARRYSLDYESAGADRLVVHELVLPRIVQKVPPHYPEEARRKRQQGRVILSVLICLDGAVGQVRTRGDAGASITAAAVDCVRRWRYEPAVLDGVPTVVWITAVVDFQLS